MPQNTASMARTPAENVYFIHMLKNVNLLYLGARVLIVLDLSYVSRFWVRAASRSRVSIRLLP